MKKLILPSLLILTIAAAGIISGCTNSDQPTASAPSTNTSTNTVQYTCSMHPDVIQSTPGKCPKCGMDLIVKH